MKTLLCEVKVLKQLLEEAGYAEKIILSVDGGIRQHTVPELRKNGADMVTPGSLVFGSENLDRDCRMVEESLL